MAVTDERLALLGGPPAITLDQQEATRWPIVEDDDLAAVHDFLATGQWWSGSPVTRQLEADFARSYGVRYALSTNNGTAALHAIYFGLGLGPGDEVIVPSYTYFSTVMPILAVGAVPVFADVEPVWGNLDPADVERRVTPRTKAVVVMHNGGMPCEMDAFLGLTGRHGLRLVEDAALAHGATYRGRKVGTFGDAAAFSFATTKLVPGIEGGMLITNDRAVLRRAAALGNIERARFEPEGPEDHAVWAAGGVPAHTRADDEYAAMRIPFGATYRMASVCAVMAQRSLAKLDARNRDRHANVHALLQLLDGITGLAPAHPPPHVERVYNFGLPYVRYDTASFGGLPVTRFAEALRAEGATVRAGAEFREWAPLHLEPVIARRLHPTFHHPANAESVGRARYESGTLPNSETPLQDRIALPLFHRPAPDLVEQYAAAFRKVARGAEALLQ